jgi:hypothetical protein
VLRWLPYLAFLVAIWPLAIHGFPRGHDWSFELVRVAEYQAALGAGQLLPYWGENLYAGYGSPIFLFYAPAFLFLSSILSWVCAIPTAATLVLIVFTLVSVWAVQEMMKAAGVEAAAARVAVYIYVLSPYLLGDKLVRNANAEFAALCLAPLVLAGLFMLGTRTGRALIWLSVGLGLAILAHNLTALVVMGLVLVGAGVLYLPTRSPRFWLTLTAGIALGLGLAAFFWIPALALNSWMRPEHLLEGKFDFHVQFPTLPKLFGYERFFSVGVLPPLLCGVGVTVAWIQRGRNVMGFRLLLAALIGSLGFGFLMTPASIPIWERVPFLPLFQFPWRMAGPLTLMSAIVASLSFAYLMQRRSRGFRAALEVGVFVVCIANAMPRLAAYQPLEPRLLEQVVRTLEPESIRNGRHSATVGDEYLPSSANPLTWRRQRPVTGPLVSLPPGVSVAVHRDTGSRIELSVAARDPARLRFARWDFPGWVLEVDGKQAAYQGNPFGSIDIQVPEGESHISLALHPPTVRRVGSLISLIALMLSVSLLLQRPRRLWRGLGP